MLIIIPFMVVFLFLGKRRKKAFRAWALCFFIPLVNKVEQLVNS